MVRKIYKTGDLLKIIFLTPIAIYAIVFLGLHFLDMKVDGDNEVYGILIIGALFGIYGGVNAYVLIDTKKDELSIPLAGVFREKVNLSDVESYDTDVKTDRDDKGKLSYKYILSFYGPFGNKSVEFSSQSDLKTVVHALRTASQNR